jgi:uncharacterized protein YdaT
MQMAKKMQQKISDYMSKEKLPDGFRSLSDEMQQKAVDMTNTLIEQGYQLPVAASMTLERVRRMSGLTNEPPAQHVVPHAEGWAVMRSDADRATAVLPTKKEAVDRGREIARNQKSKLVIHGQDGMVQDEHLYTGG